MHELNSSATSTPRRYQNPAVFEQLAIEYAIGSMHGRARQRFEKLMQQHFYLRATADAYEHKFANLVELLPEEKPSAKVWNSIESYIKKTAPATEKTPWWQTAFLKQGFGLAAMALLAASVLFFNPDTFSGPEAIAYNAVMEAEGQAMAFTKIEKSDMTLSIDIMKPMSVDDSMQLTLWCHPKKGGKPMKMGTISKSGKTELNISEQEWNDLKNVGELAVSLEKKGNNGITEPTGKVILTGQLSSIE